MRAEQAKASVNSASRGHFEREAMLSMIILRGGEDILTYQWQGCGDEEEGREGRKEAASEVVCV